MARYSFPVSLCRPALLREYCFELTERAALFQLFQHATIF